jgi:hypothetical protein
MMLRLGSSSAIDSHSNSQSEPRQEHRRETKQEREARRLEKERQARIKERERSLREEHVDGGYLVTMGTYVGPEDFNKQIVRQLQVRFTLPCLLFAGVETDRRLFTDRTKTCTVLAWFERL